MVEKSIDEKYEKIKSDNESCCGCTLCMNICPKNAIVMQKDSEGFLYPVVDKSKCINCGLCLKKCIFEEKVKEDNLDKEAFLFKHSNEDIRMHSRSGSVFVALSDYVLENNGVVYGCVNIDNKVFHQRASTKEERNLQCKSKYVQSDLRDIFSLVKKDLEDGLVVLFSGTGCQVHALTMFLKIKKIDMNNLYTIDIICHGCNSPKIFDDYIKWISKKHNNSVSSFEFRDKAATGWDECKESYYVDNKKIIDSKYRELFNTDFFLRPSCYYCKFSRVDRVSNITIGDAWGIKKYDDDFNDNKGVSLVIIQDEKGKNIFDKIKDKNIFRHVDLKNYLQGNLVKPTPIMSNRQIVWNEYYNNGFNFILKKYGILKNHKKIIEKIKHNARKIIFKDKYLP